MCVFLHTTVDDPPQTLAGVCQRSWRRMRPSQRSWRRCTSPADSVARAVGALHDEPARAVQADGDPALLSPRDLAPEQGVARAPGLERRLRGLGQARFERPQERP